MAEGTDLDLGTAGASGRREHKRRRANRESRERERHPRIGGLLLRFKDAPAHEKAWATGRRAPPARRPSQSPCSSAAPTSRCCTTGPCRVAARTSRQAPHQPTVRRYIEHAQQGTNVLLFVREQRRDALGTAPFFLGPASYVNHEGERPVAFTWRLQAPMPEELFEVARSVAAA